MSFGKSRIAAVATFAVLLQLAAVTQAAVIGRAVGPTTGDDLNVTDVLIGAPAVFTGNIPGGNWVEFSNRTNNFSDNFGLMARAGGLDAVGVVDDDPSVQLLDDSPSIFTGDNFGFVGEDDFDNFFGIMDTANSDTGFNFPDPDAPNASGDFTATWEFDVTGASQGLQISIDFAAMGDFESQGGDAFGDTLQFDYSFDGVNFTPVFVNDIFDTSFDTFDAGFGLNPIDNTIAGQEIVNLPAEVVYTMDGGLEIALNDPMTINGEVILNDFETVTAEIGAPGSNTLTLRLSAQLDSGAEAAAFRNIIIEDGVSVGGIPGDFDNDGDVDDDDFGVFAGAFGGAGPLGDFDNDGDVDDDDFGVFAGFFGTGVSSTSIPEPTTAALVAFGLVGLASRRRNG